MALRLASGHELENMARSANLLRALVRAAAENRRSNQWGCELSGKLVCADNVASTTFNAVCVLFSVCSIIFRNRSGIVWPAYIAPKVTRTQGDTEACGARAARDD